MFATTTQARALLRKAFTLANSELPRNTYTEKTTKRDTNRRSVVFPCYQDTDKVLEIARLLFKEAGISCIPKMTASDYFGSYIRVIAYMPSITE